MSAKSELSEKSARHTIAQITERYPGLHILASEREPSELDWVISIQPNIKHEICLSFSNNDELHFSVGHFMLTYFPCQDQSVARAFNDAVCGFIDGRCRIIEHYRGNKCIRADLQQPKGDEGTTLASWSRRHFPFPIFKTYKTIINSK